MGTALVMSGIKAAVIDLTAFVTFMWGLPPGEQPVELHPGNTVLKLI